MRLIHKDTASFVSGGEGEILRFCGQDNLKHKQSGQLINITRREAENQRPRTAQIPIRPQ
jgi:hypothetical protein